MDRAGIREVAKAAGVSISTVSRAFTRPELVSERTRRKVLETADKLDFNISRSATSLKSGQSYRVAMLMNEEITSWFNTEVFAGIESVMHNAGYDVSLFQHVDTAENRRDFFTNLPDIFHSVIGCRINLYDIHRSPGGNALTCRTLSTGTSVYRVFTICLLYTSPSPRDS